MCDKNFDLLSNIIINNGLCCGCGTCVGICPTHALKFKNSKYYPEFLNKSKCNSCGFCFEVCPGKGLPLKELSSKSKEKSQKHTSNIGCYLNFKIGHSNDKTIRNKSSSGGIATSLLIYALEKGVIDKAIVVINDKEKLVKPVVKVTNSKEVLLESMQSKYIQVPLNTAIKEILNNDQRYGIVGLPCHIEGLKLAQNIYKVLSKRIIFKIGLFCGYSYSYDCIDTLIKKMGCNKKDINKFLGWREGKNYPGSFSVELKNGKRSKLSYIKEHNIDVPFFALFRCYLCIDGLNQLADLSLGDSTNPTKNETFIISRTNAGESLLESAKNNDFIDYYTLTDEIAMKNGIIPFMIKEKHQKSLTVIHHLNGRIATPDWSENKPKISFIDKLNALGRVYLVLFIRIPIIKKIFINHLDLMENIGGKVYRFNLNPKTFLINKIIKFSQNYPKFIKFMKRVH